MKKFIFLFSFLLILSSVLAGCNKDNNTTETNIITETETTVTQTTIGYFQTDEDVFKIETKYCDLYYPSKWENYVNVDIAEEENYTVSFSYKTDYETIPLFDLVFGKSDAYKLGTLTFETEQIDVYIINYEILEQNYSQNVYLDLCAMIEDVNVVISKLIEYNNFLLA